MGDSLTQYYLTTIEDHQRSHIQQPALSIIVLQTIAPDLSCLECFPPRPTGGHSTFIRFWNWYSREYQVITYSRKTQSAYTKLVTASRPTARCAARDIIFSCRYCNNVPPPRHTISLLFRSYTSHFTIPQISNNRNYFDNYIDNPNFTHLSIQITTETETGIQPENLPHTIPAETYITESTSSSSGINQEETTEATITSAIVSAFNPPETIAITIGNVTEEITPVTNLDNPIDRTSSTFYTPTPSPVIAPDLGNSAISELALPQSSTLATTDILEEIDNNLPTNTTIENPQNNPTLEATNTPYIPLYPSIEGTVQSSESNTNPFELPRDFSLPLQSKTSSIPESPTSDIDLAEIYFRFDQLILTEPETSNQENKMSDSEGETEPMLATAKAIKQLAKALDKGGKGEKNLIKIDAFKGDGSQDPIDWLDEFDRAAKANHWSSERQLELAKAYMKGIAEEWVKIYNNDTLTAYDDEQAAETSFKKLFKDRFSTARQKAKWQQQFFDLKQGSDTVDAYIAKFKRLNEKVPDLPETFQIQHFIKGLRPEFAMPVQASAPENLAEAIDTSRLWETGKFITSDTDTKDAIAQLTDQIAKLSINLAQQQQSQPQKPAYTAESKPTQSKTKARCFYCGNPGHYIADCYKKKADDQKNRGNRSYYQDRNSQPSRYRGRDNRSYRNDRSQSRSRSRSRDRNYSRRNRSRSRERSQERWGPRSNRSPSPYYRNVNMAETKPKTTRTWEDLLDNYSIRTALTAYITDLNRENTLPKPINYITPVKCYIDIQDQTLPAIIDSGAAVSMISHQTVKDLGLKIEEPSTSLIVAATGTTSRPLGIIRNLPIRVQGKLIPLDVEVVPATSYSLLLGNDWSKKVEANYNWKTCQYTIYWKGKKIVLDTSYEQTKPTKKQPTCTTPEDFELYEEEYLIPHEAYAFTTEEQEEEESWTTYTSRRQNNHFCRTCKLTTHITKNCPENICYYCHQKGHILINCPKKQVKRNTCKNCNQNDHLFKDCPHNLCYGCNQAGHIEINCPLAQQKLDNLTYRCGCDKNQVEERRLTYYSKRRTHHCCGCLTPERSDNLHEHENRLICTTCYKTYFEALEMNDPQSQEYYQYGLGRGTLVYCKVCNIQRPRSRMHQLESIREELWFCELEHMYAYKVSQDVQYNPNYDIWTRIQHYTESTQSAGSQYDLNKNRIYRIAMVLLGESDMEMTEAIEEQETDQYNRDWTSDEITILLRDEAVLTEDEEATLQRILRESFDIAHPDFDSQKAIENLRKNFEGKVQLCNECLLAKQLDELEPNQGYCDECYQELTQLTLPTELPEEKEENPDQLLPELNIVEPLQLPHEPEEKDEIIERLEARVQYLEQNFEQITEFLKQQIVHHQRRADYYSNLLASQQNFH
jgi:hypothetical protein